MLKKILLYGFIGVILIFSISCTKNSEVNNIEPMGSIEEFTRFFPNSNYTWEYIGTGNYYHRMQLIEILEKSNKIIYKINGEVKTDNIDDNFEKFLFTIRYVVTNKGIRQEKTSEKIRDSKYDDLYIIKYPIKIGNKWEEDVFDSEGNKQKIVASIENIEKLDTGLEVTIKYDEKTSTYYERRTLKENIGIIKFEKNIKYKNTNHIVGYNLSEILNIEDSNNGDIKRFLISYNKAWQDYFNRQDEYVFKFLTKESELNVIFEKLEKNSIRIEFKKVDIINILKKDNFIEVTVKEYYNKTLNDNSIEDTSIIKYSIRQVDGEFLIDSYRVTDE